MELEVKMRLLASNDPTLQGIFGSSTFRWFGYAQLPQGYINKGTCVRVRRISTVSSYAQEAPVSLEKIRMQFDCMDFNVDSAYAAAKAINAWLTGTADFMNPGQFQSPATGPRQHANYQSNQRIGIETQLEREVYVVMTDFIIFNDSTI